MQRAVEHDEQGHLNYVAMPWVMIVCAYYPIIILDALAGRLIMQPFVRSSNAASNGNGGCLLEIMSF